MAKFSTGNPPRTMHVFDRDLLLPLAAAAIEGIKQIGKAARIPSKGRFILHQLHYLF